MHVLNTTPKPIKWWNQFPSELRLLAKVRLIASTGTGDITLDPILLFAIIFMWTPPHFWALALCRSGEYEKAGVHMMPAVSGVPETKKLMLIYTILLWPLTIAPAITGLISIPASIIIGVLGFWFVRHAWVVLKSKSFDAPRAMFKFSIFHLFFIFIILLIDRSISQLL